MIKDITQELFREFRDLIKIGRKEDTQTQLNKRLKQEEHKFSKRLMKRNSTQAVEGKEDNTKDLELPQKNQMFGKAGIFLNKSNQK